MIKLFNQSISGLGLTKAKSFIRASFLNGRRKWIGSLAAGFVVVGALLLMLNPAAADDDRHDNSRKLHFIPHFNPPVTTFVGPFSPPIAVGEQLTFGGTLAHPDRPDIQIGTVAVHFVVALTAPAGDELLGNGCIILPDGKISTQILLRRPAPRDSHGDINRYSAITGGTGAYRNARGEVNHVTHANGAEELILTFSGD
jgi:hypothetical protein